VVFKIKIRKKCSYMRLNRILLTAIIISTILPITAFAEARVFPDVPNTHWAYENVEWGVENGAISGYDDGTFKPDNQVTEAEFLKMLVSSYEGLLSVANEEWYAGYYNFAIDHQWEVPGTILGNGNKKTIAIKRGTVAAILSNAMGVAQTSVDKYIQVLYDDEISSGKVDKTIEGYKADDNLTRAEAIRFIEVFKSKNKNDKLLPKAPKKVDSTSNAANNSVALGVAKDLAKENSLSYQEENRSNGDAQAYLRDTSGKTVLLSYRDNENHRIMLTLENPQYASMMYNFILRYVGKELTTSQTDLFAKLNVDHKVVVGTKVITLWPNGFEYPTIPNTRFVVTVSE
jgi:hypothetical protein